ncbi:MAG: TonB-dependent receptor, partial [Chitinophagia bacterium]|nr:TonB-dependent receptor [Chitinophagia bacterium]
ALFLTRGKGYYEEYKQGELYADYGIANPISPKGDTQFATDLTRQLWLDNYYYGGLFSMLYSKNKLKINLGGAFTQFENLGYGYVLWAQQGGIANNYQWYRHDAQKNDFNTYIKLNYALTGIDFYGEMQYRTIAYFMNGFRKNPSLKHVVNYDFYNPKAGFSLRIGNQWVVKQKLYASIAVAHREPNRATFETNATLPKPEQLTDYEAGYEVKSNKASLAVNGYYMNYRNQLVLTGQINDVGAYTQTNVKESYRSGIEVEASVQLAKWWQTGGNITLSANKIKNFTEYIDNYDSTAQRVNTYSLTDIAFSPSIIGCFTNRFSVEGKKHNRLELDVSLKHVGSQYLDNTSNSQRKIGDYTYTNLLLKYAIHPRSMQQISASLQMNNLFGSLYANNGYTSSSIADRQLTTANYYYPQAGINFLAGLQLVW